MIVFVFNKSSKLLMHWEEKNNDEMCSCMANKGRCRFVIVFICLAASTWSTHWRFSGRVFCPSLVFLFTRRLTGFLISLHGPFQFSWLTAVIVIKHQASKKSSNTAHHVDICAVSAQQYLSSGWTRCSVWCQDVAWLNVIPGVEIPYNSIPLNCVRDCCENLLILIDSTSVRMACGFLLARKFWLCWFCWCKSVMMGVGQRQFCLQSSRGSAFQGGWAVLQNVFCLLKILECSTSISRITKPILGMFVLIWMLFHSDSK